MRYRPDLERLATLDAARIDLACTSPDAIRDLIDHALDEALEHEVSADDAYARGDADECRRVLLDPLSCRVPRVGDVLPEV